MSQVKIFYKKTSFYLIRSCFFLSILFIIPSCMGVKPGATKSGGKSYETFFVGEEGTQYFIKPLKLSTDSNEYLELDITFRYKNEVKGLSTLNISFITNEKLNSIDSLEINNGDTSIFVKKISHLFTERDKNMYSCRFSSEVDLIDLKTLFEKSDWKVSPYRNGLSTNYMATKSTTKAITTLNYDIFDLF